MGSWSQPYQARNLLIQIFGTSPLLAALSLLACIGFGTYALQLAPPGHQPLELEHRFR